MGAALLWDWDDRPKPVPIELHQVEPLPDGLADYAAAWRAAGRQSRQAGGGAVEMDALVTIPAASPTLVPGGSRNPLMSCSRAKRLIST